MYPNPKIKTIAFPNCISPSTYGVTQFWAEEYWTWLKIQELKSLYPKIDLEGLINSVFENQLLNLLKFDPHKKITGTRDYNDIQVNSWEVGNRKLNIATSHAPSRFKAQSYSKKYTNEFRIINFDAHFDIGNSEMVHSAWLTHDLAMKTAVIGGWSETSEDLTFAKKIFPIISSQLEDFTLKKRLKNWLKRKKVYITLDLDFFPSSDNYLGLSCFWHRHLFIGHSMNIRQRIELERDIQVGQNGQFAGVELQLFDDISLFIKQKKKSILSQIGQIKNILRSLIDVFQENSAHLLSFDLVEYSPICDWQNFTIEEFNNNFHHFKDLINKINE